MGHHKAIELPNGALSRLLVELTRTVKCQNKAEFAFPIHLKTTLIYLTAQMPFLCCRFLDLLKKSFIHLLNAECKVMQLEKLEKMNLDDYRWLKINTDGKRLIHMNA